MTLVPSGPRPKDYLVADIHRNENLSTPAQYHYVLQFLNAVGERLDLPVKLVRFSRAQRLIDEHRLLDGLDRIQVVGPFGFLKYLEFQYGSAAVISDSGTAQEECPLLGVPAIVPRNFTERPESVEFGNSILVGENRPLGDMVDDSIKFLESYCIDPAKIQWLGDGHTAERIVRILKEELV